MTMVDDDGDEIINSTKNVYCESGTNTHTKFWVKYEGPENCAGSVAPTSQVSKGDLVVTATTNDAELEDVLRIQCKR